MKEIHKNDEIRVYLMEDESFNFYDCSVSCGTPTSLGDITMEKVKASDILECKSDETYIVEVMGDSMKGMGVNPGDKIVIEARRTAKHEDVVLASVDGEFLLKVLIVDEYGVSWLSPTNNNYKPIRIDGNRDVKIWGVMVSRITPCAPPSVKLLGKLTDAIKEEYQMLRLKTDEESFYKYIPNDLDKGKIMQKLHSIVDGKSGVDVIKVLRSAIDAGVVINMPSYADLTKTFDVKLAKSYFYRVKDKMFLDSELKPFMAFFE